MKKLLALVVLVILLSACGPAITQEDHDAVVEQASALEAALVNSQTGLDQVTNRLHLIESELSVSTVSLSELQSQYNDLDAEYRDLNKTIKDLKREHDIAISEYFCSEKIRVDFTSNYTVGRSLIEFVADRAEDPVSGNWWKIFWTGDKHSLHTVEAWSKEDRVNYVWEFIVYFRGEFYGEHPNGVFWTGAGCWLYRDDS